jgi:type IV secretion system protein VirD4
MAHVLEFVFRAYPQLWPWYVSGLEWYHVLFPYRWWVAAASVALVVGVMMLIAHVQTTTTSSDSHGSARVSTAFEILRSRVFHGTGIPVGQLWGCRLRLDEEEDVLVIGPKGSGKSRRVIMYAIDEFPGKVICLDQSGELLAQTGRARLKRGEVYVLDFSNPKGHHYNYLDAVRWNPWDEISDLQRIADHLTYLNPKITRTQAGTFYVAQTQDLYIASLLYGHYDYPGLASVGALRRFVNVLLTEVESKTRPTFEQMAIAPKSPALVHETAEAFAKMPKALLGAILAGAKQWLMPWADPKLDTVTADTTIPLSAFQQLATPATLYLRVNIEDIQGRLRPAARLFCDQFCFRLCDRPPDNERQAVVHDILWVFDDMKGLGNLRMICDVPEHRRKWGHRFLGACQDLGQLKDTFGPNYGGLLSNCTSKVFFRPSNHEDAEWLVREIDQATVTVTQNGHEQLYGRPVLTVDELKRLGREQVLVFTPDTRPAILNQLPYYES